MDERRRQKRLVIGEKASLKSGETHECFLVDISRGGMKVLLAKEIKAGDPISGQFKILPNAGPFYVKGIVTWARPIKEKNANFAIGVKFTDITTIPF